MNLIKKLQLVLIIVIIASAFIACTSPKEEVTVIELTDEEIEDVRESISESKDLLENARVLRPTNTDIPPLNRSSPPVLEGDKKALTIKVGSLRGPSGMGMSYMIEQNELGKLDTTYRFTMSGALDKISDRISTGDLDIAMLPTDLASLLYFKTDGAVQLLGVNTLSLLYIVENGNQIKKFSDLEGKEIIVSGKAAAPEYIFASLLKSAEINKENMPRVTYTIEAAEAATALASGRIDLALLPEPFVTTVLQRNKKLRIALDLTEEWRSYTNDAVLAMGCIIVNKEFASKNKALVEKFVKDYNASINYVNNDPKAASLLIEKHKILKNARQAVAMIPRSQMTWIDAETAKEDVIIYLKSIGGKVPDENFFYQLTRDK